MVLSGIYQKIVNRYVGSFTGRAGIILLGSLLGQGIATVLLPLITRFYPVEVIGRTATVLAIVSISGLVVCFQYDQALVIAPNEDLKPLAILSLTIASLWFLLLSAIIGLDAFIGLNTGSRYLDAMGVNWLLPVLVWLYGLFIIAINYHLRRDRLKQVSLGRIFYYGGAAVFQVVGGYIWGGSDLVFLGMQSLGALAGILILVPYKDVLNYLRRSIASQTLLRQEIRRVATKYKKFPRYQMPANFINSVSLYMPVLFLRFAFSETWAGWYYIAWRVLAAPTTLLSQAVGQIFYRDSAELERLGKGQADFLKNVVHNLLRVSFLPAVGFAILSPYIIPWLLGDDWAVTATIIQIMMISVTVTFIVSPISMLLNVKGLQADDLRYKSLLFVVRSFTMGLGFWLQSELGFVALYTIGSVLVLLFYLRFVLRSAAVSLLEVVRRALGLFLAAVALLLVGALLDYFVILNSLLGIAILGSILFAAMLAEFKGWMPSLSLA